MFTMKRQFTLFLPDYSFIEIEVSICYECKKPGHVRPECPQVKGSNKKVKRRAMLAAWGNSSDDDSSDEENEQANLCFIVLLQMDINSFFTQDTIKNSPSLLHSSLPPDGGREQ